MEVQGSIKVIGEVQEISATFKKRELVLTTDEQYPQTKEIKYFNSIQGWRIELTENKSDINEDLPPLDNLSPFEPASETNDEDLDDLPF